MHRHLHCLIQDQKIYDAATTTIANAISAHHQSMYHVDDDVYSMPDVARKMVPFLRSDSNMSQCYYYFLLLHCYSYSLIYGATFARDDDGHHPFDGDVEAFGEGH